MSLINRSGRNYYYRNKKKNGKVISEYVGSGELALISAKLDQHEQQAKKEQQAMVRTERAKSSLLDAKILDLEKTLSELFTWVAIASGYYLHKREWRQSKNNQPKK